MDTNRRTLLAAGAAAAAMTAMPRAHRLPDRYATLAFFFSFALLLSTEALSQRVHELSRARKRSMSEISTRRSSRC